MDNCNVNFPHPLLEVENLSMHFTAKRRGKKNTVKAVNDVSFKVYPGETFGLVGESGCGKTTTGRTVIRLYDPTGGSVRFDGRVISGKMTPELRRYITDNIAMIFQDPIASLNPRMTVQEIIGEGLKIRGITDEAQRYDMIIDMLQRVGLQEEHATRYPHEFSGGQRQRIGIARALVVKPKLVIADEPVSALDVSVQAQVINLLNQLKQDLGLTILFIAHNLSVVKYFSDRVGVMHEGKLVELADSKELFQNPTHPYTKALMSAIPQPDPRSERNRQHIYYDAQSHGYSKENSPSYHEVSPGHMIYCSDEELQKFQQE